MIRKTAMLGGLLLATGLALPAMAQDSAIRIVMPSRRCLRFIFPASRERKRLVRTASAPEIAIPWPASPSVTPKSLARGVSRLTGINSEAIRTNTQRVMAKMPPQYACSSCCEVVWFNVDIV